MLRARSRNLIVLAVAGVSMAASARLSLGQSTLSSSFNRKADGSHHSVSDGTNTYNYDYSNDNYWSQQESRGVVFGQDVLLDPSNWSTPYYPSNGNGGFNYTATTSSDVELNVGVTLDGYTNSGTLYMDAGCGVGLTGGANTLANNGELRMNWQYGAQSSSIGFAGDGTLAGGGKVTMVGPSSIYAAGTLEIGAGQVIDVQDFGSISGGAGVVHNGTTFVDSAGNLSFGGASSSNAGTFLADGVLTIAGSYVTQASTGAIFADKGTVYLNGTHVRGGFLGSADAGGRVVLNNATLESARLAGRFDVPGGTSTTLIGALVVGDGAVFTLNGDSSVYSGGLVYSGEVIPAPAGTFVIRMAAPARIAPATGVLADEFFNLATCTITGSGSISGQIFNFGLIRAAGAGQALTVDLTTPDGTNGNVGTLLATAGATLRVTSGKLKTIGPVMAEAGGTLAFAGGATIDQTHSPTATNVSDGTVTIRSGGAFSIDGSKIVNGAFVAEAGSSSALVNSLFLGVTSSFAGGASVPSGMQAEFSGGSLSLGGTLSVNADANVYNASVLFDGEVPVAAISPGATISLAAPATLATTPGSHVSFGPGVTISGSGSVSAAASFEGATVIASNGILSLDTGDKDAHNTAFLATSGGTLTLSGNVALRGTSPISAGASSLVNLYGVNLDRAEVTSAAGGLVTIGSSTLTQGSIDAFGRVVLNSCTLAAAPVTIEAGGQVDIPGGSAVTMTSPFNVIAGPGTLAVNSDGVVYNAVLSVSDDLTFLDNLDVRLGGAAVINAATPGSSIEIAAGSRIHGTGGIALATTNRGTIVADVPGVAISLSTDDVANLGTIAATGGGIVTAVGINITGPGTISATGASSLVSLSGVHVSNQLLTSSGGASLTASGTAFSTVTLSGGAQLTIGSGLSDTLDGPFTLGEKASVVLNGEANVYNTSLVYAGPVTLGLAPGASSASVLMAPNGGPATLSPDDPTSTLTVSPGVAIRGAGAIYGTVVNHGLIEASVSGQVLATAAAVTSDGTLRAANGATLSLQPTAVYNSGPIEAAANSTVGIDSASVTNLAGGSVHASATGKIRIAAGVLSGGTLGIDAGASLLSQSGTLSHVSTTLSGTASVPSGYALTLDGGTFGGPGTLTLNSDGNVYNSALDVVGTVALAGTGTVRLGSPSTVTTEANSVLTVGSAYHIAGAGAINAMVDNAGEVAADVPGGTLAISAFLLNRSAAVARNAGTLLISGSFSQTATGSITAAGGAVLLSGANVTGGQLASTAGTTLTATASTLAGVTLTAGSVLGVPGAQSLALSTSFANNGTVFIPTFATPYSSGLAIADPLTLTGTGSVILQQSVAVISGQPLANGAGHTLAGIGYIYAHLANFGKILSAPSPIETSVASAALVIAGPLTSSGTIGTTGASTLSLDNITTLIGGGQVLSTTLGPVISTTGLTVTSGTTVKAGNGALVLAPASSFAIDDTGKLDVTAGAVIFDYPESSTTPADSVRAMIASAYAGNAWTGPGITTSLANALPNHIVGIGYGEARDLFLLSPSQTHSFAGYAADSSSVLVVATYLGDSDLSGAVDANDLANFFAGYYGQLQGWTNGDFNYDGAVTPDDLSILLNALAKQGASLGASGGDGGGAAVPEPAVAFPLALLSAATAICRRKRR